MDMHGGAAYCNATSCSGFISTTSPNDVIVIIVSCHFKCDPSVTDTAGSIYLLRTNQTGSSGSFTSSISEFYTKASGGLLTLDKITVTTSGNGNVQVEFLAIAHVGMAIWDPTPSLPTVVYHNYAQGSTTNLTVSTSPTYSNNLILVPMTINDGGACYPAPSPFSTLDEVGGNSAFYYYQALTSLDSLKFSCNSIDLMEVMADGICSISSCGEDLAVVRGTDNGIYWSTFSGFWSNWQYLSGSTSSTPSLCSSSPTRTDLVLRGTDNGIYHKSFINGVWSAGWDSPGGGTLDQPACVVANGILHVVVRGTDNGTWYNSMLLSTGAWSGWSVVSGGSTLSAPSLTVDASGTVHLLVRGTDNGIWYASKPSGGSWTPWKSPGGSTPDTPAMVSDSNFLYVVVRGTDDDIWYNSQSLSSGTWSGWSSIGGSTSSAPSLMEDSSGTLDLVVRGTDNGIWHNLRTPSGSWAGWDTPGGATLSQPAATVQGSTLFIVVRGSDNGVWANTWSLATRSWSNWSSLGGTTSAMPSIATSA